MTEFVASSSTALWLGVLTAISPCPLATNIAAISFIGKDLGSSRRVLASGVAYTLGRTLAYVLVGALVVASLLSIPGVAWFLQTRMNQILGPILILVGTCLLGWIKFRPPGIGLSEALQRRAARAGVLGAALLGMLFALSFCPVSAGLFFGSLVPLSVSARSPVAIPALFGIGTGLPVVAFAVMIALGTRYVGEAFHLLSRIERWARVATGVIFIAVGVYLVAGQIHEWLA